MRKASMTAAISLWCAATATLAQTSVGVSVEVRQPGMYGRIDIGRSPVPAVVYSQPIIVMQPTAPVQRAPVYLYVPPGHQKNWAKHCARYAACGQPVYFVREDWVRERYEHEHARAYHDDDRGHGHGKGHGKSHGKGHGNGHD